MVACIIILCLMVFNLGINLVKHGKPKQGIEGEYNFWITLIGYSIDIVLFYFAGLFNCFSK